MGEFPYDATIDYDTQGMARYGTIRGTAGRLHQLVLVNTRSTPLYIQLFNALYVPVDGTVPDFPPILLRQQNVVTVIDTPALGYLFTLGICWCASETPTSKTLVPTEAVWVHALHIGLEVEQPPEEPPEEPPAATEMEGLDALFTRFCPIHRCVHDPDPRIYRGAGRLCPVAGERLQGYLQRYRDQDGVPLPEEPPPSFWD